MSVKPELVFDVCWEVYRGAREVLEAKRGMSAMDWKEATKFLWRPDFRPRLSEWVADFALAGQAALEGPDCASRMVLFRLYYLGLAPYENTRHYLGLSEQSWVNWSEEVRRRVGKETAAPRHVPATKIFHEWWLDATSETPRNRAWFPSARQRFKEISGAKKSNRGSCQSEIRRCSWRSL
jgi:hypothetical protein